MNDNILFSWTPPYSDWLIGVEYIPEVELPDLEFYGSMFSIGILIFRVDFLTNKQEE